MTDYEWEMKECHQQRTYTISYKNSKDTFFYPINREMRERDRRKQVYYLI